MNKSVRVILLDEADAEYQRLNELVGQQIQEGQGKWLFPVWNVRSLCGYLSRNDYCFIDCKQSTAASISKFCALLTSKR